MDKLAEEILESYFEPDSGWINKELIIKAMQAYHEAKLKKKRLDYDKWLKDRLKDTEPTEPPVLKTSQEWYDEYPIEILDPDGWDRNNFDFSWYEEKITFAEFDRRAMASTCMIKKP